MQRFEATPLNVYTPVPTDVAMNAWWVLPLQSCTSSIAPLPVPLNAGPRHLFWFAFIAIFQLLPLGRRKNCCPSPAWLWYCCTIVPLLVDPYMMSTEEPVAFCGTRR